MKEKRPIRIIKRDERERAGQPAEAVAESPAVSSERKLKSVISSWVRDHHERTEEYKRMFATILREAGLRPPRTGMQN
jgi:hypothetical protein